MTNTAYLIEDFERETKTSKKSLMCSLKLAEQKISDAILKLEQDSFHETMEDDFLRNLPKLALLFSQARRHEKHIKATLNENI